MIRSILPTESQIQCAIVDWANNTFFEHPKGGKSLLAPYLIKITNEGRRGWQQGKKIKAEGMRKGAADLFLAIPIIVPHSHRYNGFWLEIKKKGKEPTDEQCEFLAAMRKIGYHSDWKDTVDGAIQAIKDYLGMK